MLEDNYNGSKLMNNISKTQFWNLPEFQARFIKKESEKHGQGQGRVRQAIAVR